ncbi:MAG: hypothetical protein BWY19_01206 [bacterium ADurb.Bin212]|nr:MAG: hypothetical protein BWY19_01206 [bacterium ADurb.Bin212]
MKTKVLITVKTYPTPSGKYDELVCTAGFREDGSWVRIYPVPFRKAPYSSQYKKYDWIEVDLEKNTSDFRPESYRPVSDIKIIGHINTNKNWQKRKEIVLKNVYTDLKQLIDEAKSAKRTSLAVFKPTEIIDFIVEPTERDWDSKKLEQLQQLNLFEERLKPVNKLPYNFYYKLKDINGVESRMLVEDWEAGALYWNMRFQRKCTEKEAIEHVKNKFLTNFLDKTDLYLFFGTTKLHHMVSRNPFIIIGVFYPQKLAS